MRLRSGVLLTAGFAAIFACTHDIAPPAQDALTLSADSSHGESPAAQPLEGSLSAIFEKTNSSRTRSLPYSLEPSAALARPLGDAELRLIGRPPHKPNPYPLRI
jgi:hypothetical protein